jgi:glutamyl-tRNA reductase
MIPCNWQLVLCGINHKTATLPQREPLQIGRDELAQANSTLGYLDGIKEAVVLSTCNRVEFYMIADHRRDACEIVSSFYRKFKNIDISNLKDNFYTRRDKHAADHLFRVAAGIDSMVLGENEVLGQTREAYSSACAVKTAGKVLHGLFHQAFRIGKKVRSDTELGKGACSVSTATIEMIRAKIDTVSRSRPTILFIGLNQMISLATSRLKRRGFERLIFANRTEQKAIDFAASHNAKGYSLEKLPELLSQADIVISCTGSNKAIIDDSMMAEVVSANPDKKLLIADMAVPRDVELKKSYQGITRYDLEDVKQFVKDQQNQRELAIPEAEEIIDRRLDQFMYWFDHVRHEPLYNGLGDTFENIRRQEINKLLETLPGDSHDLVDRATRRLVERLLQVKGRVSLSPEKPEH